MSDIVIGHLVISSSPLTESSVPVRLVTAAPEPKKNEAKAFRVLEVCLDAVEELDFCYFCKFDLVALHEMGCPLFGVVDHREVNP